MSKVDDMLEMMQSHLGEWCCAVCASNSNQPAAVFRELKKRGYNFEKTAPNRWAKSLVCNVCQTNRSHYKLLTAEPEFVEKLRFGISNQMRKRILDLLDNKDAFTGATISSVAEIDHKIPWTRLEEDINTEDINDVDILESFQLLTREHNLLKDRMCRRCKLENKRPPFFEIAFWYQGNCNYEGTCVGCGWYDGKMWRSEISKKINNE